MNWGGRGRGKFPFEMGDLNIKSEAETDNGNLLLHQSDELDHVPLKLRLQSHFLNPLVSPSGALKDENEEPSLQVPLSSDPSCDTNKVKDEQLSPNDDNAQKGNNGNDLVALQDCNSFGAQSVSVVFHGQVVSNQLYNDILWKEKVDDHTHTVEQHSDLLDVKAEPQGTDESSVGGVVSGSFGHHLEVAKVKNEIIDYFDADDLDHMKLKDRHRMLLSRDLLKLAKLVEEGSKGPSYPVGGNSFEHSSGRVELHNQSIEEDDLKAINICGVIGRYDFDLGRSSRTKVAAGAYWCSRSNGSCRDNESSESRHIKDTPGTDMTCSFQRVSTKACEDYPTNQPYLALTSEAKVKAEVLEYDLPTSVNISLENMKCSRKILPSSSGHSLNAVESATHINAIHHRKRRKTATDCVQTALEEDAPGLLQILLEKGVTVDEIKLYNETESDDALDESLCEDSFGELEAVISKLFSSRSSLLKLAPLRYSKGSKISYCLACLLSLVEQSRYLQFRKWPVEWGWCRDLQSFIFVFERHNRIVLERPEYGYATYFFELVDSLPVEWQVKRLVTAMKLTSCGRATLLENKALVVGEDLSEGEARVLQEFGWLPNTGLGTMLNYCDRVVHDRRSEVEAYDSEWRSKIAKLLMDGYNGGTIIPNYIPKRVIDSEGPQIKMEL
ncbi:hypothetical protein RJ641_006425 [Dillenia turbinata]|uniref:Uncharacterized protein n=1 Tax=Dillenia turbinata TaxID=194707 RepID=A0AAN8V6V1_9MAGN